MDKDNKEVAREEGTEMQVLPEEQLEWIREVWAKYVNHEIGGISLIDACDALYELGLHRTEAEIAIMFQEFDLDPSDPITVEQFLSVMTKAYHNLFDIESLKAAFNVFDVGKSGYFKVTEMRAIAVTMGIKFTEEEFEEMVREVDLNNDGKICWEEFLQAMRS